MQGDGKPGSNPVWRALAVVLLVGTTCLAGGNLVVTKILDRSPGVKEKKPPCASSTKLASFAPVDCEPTVQLHPMRFR